MRVFYFLLLVILVAPVVIFAVQNQEDLSLTFLNYSLTYPRSLVIGIAYVLGMLSGSTLVGLLRRSFRRATEFPENRS